MYGETANGRGNYPHKLFWENPYMARLETNVTSTRGSAITLADTIFYACSGGQESDCGTIADYPVLQATTLGADIEYLLPEGAIIKPGMPVTVLIDWDRRYNLMRMHSLAEIVLQLANGLFEGLEKIGAHIAPNKARLDFGCVENISRLFPVIASRVTEIVVADIDIVTGFTDEALERRYWQIEGFKRVPCCGTHPKRTGELGAIALKRDNIGKGKERIEILRK